MIKKFQNQRLGILRDIHQIEAFRTPDHVELTEFMAIDFDLLQNCVWLGCVDDERARMRVGNCGEEMSASDQIDATAHCV